MTDAEAIQRVLGGDVEAFSVLIQRYHPACLRYARRMLRDRETAEDVVQETFVRAYHGLRGYDHRGRTGAWLFRILVNRCRSAAASRRRHLADTDLDGIPSAAQPSTPAPDVLGRVTAAAAVASLPPDQREAFLLHYVEGQSYEEMSFVLGAGISALKMRVARARDHLRKELAHEYP
jgi:RNA polymerase sigma-70 factor, ECF subfamily